MGKYKCDKCDFSCNKYHYFLNHKNKIHPKLLELEEKHIKNTKLVTNRIEQLHLLPKNGIVIEIGVGEGNYSEHILKITKPKKLYLLEVKKYRCDKLKEKFANYIKEGTIEVINESSYTAHTKFEENYFDFIYIDANHSYKGVNRDIYNFYKKIKEDGYMVLNDYIYFDHILKFHYGVMQAVNEFCINNDWEIVYYTLDTLDFKDVILKKI